MLNLFPVFLPVRLFSVRGLTPQLHGEDWSVMARGWESRASIARALAAMEVIREFFDDIEALAFMEDGDVIARSEYEFIVISLPRRPYLLDLVAEYIESTGAEIDRRTRQCIYFSIPLESGGRLSMRACRIHTHGNRVYLAIEPLKIKSR